MSARNGLHSTPVILLVLLTATMSVAQTTAPASARKLYELRMETCLDGKLPELHARLRDHAMRLFARHGMENMYYWTVSEGAAADDAKNMVVYLLGHKDRASADASWAAIGADPEWVAAIAKSEENGKLLSKPASSVFMSPTDFSPTDEPVNAKSDAPARLFELRKYNTGPAQLPGTVDRFKSGEAALFSKNGMATLNFWTASDDSAFIYLLAHKDRETSRASWATFFTEFRQFQTEYNARRGATPATRGGAPATRGARGGTRGGGGGSEIRFLLPTDYSPRK